MAAETVKADDGTNLPLAEIVNNFGYTGSNITSISVEYPPGSGNIYMQTFVYSQGVIVSTSGWVKQ